MPVSIVACQARSLEGEHGPSYTPTDRCQQTTESGPFLRSTARSSQIIINDNNFGEAQLFRSICQSVLALFAFHMVANLVRRGLPHIDISSPFQMMAANLLAHSTSLSLFSARSPTVPSIVLGSSPAPAPVTLAKARRPRIEGCAAKSPVSRGFASRPPLADSA